MYDNFTIYDRKFCILNKYGSGFMSDTIKAALITGVFGLIATIVAAIIGIRFGKSSEQKNI